MSGDWHGTGIGSPGRYVTYAESELTIQFPLHRLRCLGNLIISFLGAAHLNLNSISTT